jgi:CheY-like chemotaxis protein
MYINPNPLASPVPAEPSGVAAASLTPKRSLRVLCIDDDSAILELVKDSLAYYRHWVQVAAGGKYGIELFQAAILKGEPYDVVITDMNMPEVNGLAVTRMIKAQCPTTPVILITGLDIAEIDAELKAAAVSAVLSKPLHMRELNDQLLRLTQPA